ncbi:MAG: UDP-N-acetylglucosamine 2-epimerase (non-hydrolyzing), partial [Bacteriovoracaceae bacterium]|nr:UDP-N-acetylglucosamine 2-epimerase (non-hydrolyzing) [Bacteriovoracaceae bacterium]
MKILSVVGTRPNFMMIAPLINEINKQKVSHMLVHTGQHYDQEMSKLFFDDLEMPKPDINLGIGSGTNKEQVKKVMRKLEKILEKEKPDLVIVVGDVNSTLAAARISKKLGIKIAHIESGLRSFDLTMPEETNRIETDKISDFLFTTEESANKNLKNEGISENKIFFVGNVMIDTLLNNKEKSQKSKILENFNLDKKNYALLTLHRPSNVDKKEDLEKIFTMLTRIQEKIKVIFPVHPRTKKKFSEFGFDDKIKEMENLMITNPLGYLDFLCLMANSKLVLTDSGGIQEETTVLGVPCITLRENTERPVTVEQGTNLIVSIEEEKIIKKSLEIIENKINTKNKIPELW